MSGLRLFSAACLLAVLSLTPALAEMPADGTFTAAKACPALQSIRKNTNPGEVMTSPGQGYRILAKNQKKPSHYRIEVPGADPAERWVEATCGSADMAKAEKPKAPEAKQAGSKPAQGPAKSYVLAITWQPAFCEAMSRKRECRSQSNSRFDATHFTLHGLWPQPGTNVYCGVSGQERQASTDSNWEGLPPLRLDLKTAAALDQAMPGSQSYLDRHEWTKHGTCYPGHDPDSYFRDALRLLEAINTSPVQELMAANIGREVSTKDIRAGFDEAFGPGAGERVRVACKDDGNRRLISEITIGLKGDIPGGAAVADLILASGPTDAGCPGGVVDPVGLQ